MSRWRVERGSWWVAMLLDKQGHEITGTAKRFTTHAEAIAYADQMSRTITVTLPRGVEKVHLGPNAWLELRSDGGASVHGGCGSTGIRKYALERTALALLAHVRRN